MNDDTISVLPRILDPSMRFTINSIKNMPTKNEIPEQYNLNSNSKVISNNNELPKKSNITQEETKETKETKNTINNENKFFIFFSNYKYVILTIIIVILLIILGVLIYNYFTNNNNNKSENKENKTHITTDVKQKIDNYISNYIIDEDNTESNDADNTESNNEDNTESNNEDNTESSMMIQATTLVNNPIKFVIEDHIIVDPSISLDASPHMNLNRFEEINNLDTNSLSETNELDKLSETNELDKLSETNELDKLSETNESDKLSETNESIDLNDIIHELNNQTFNDNNKKSKNNNKSKLKKKEIKSENVDHFKAFINKNE